MTELTREQVAALLDENSLGPISRAYDLARAGETVELAARKVMIFDVRLLDAEDADHVTLEMDCGKGTYVRALVRDIAEALGAEIPEALRKAADKSRESTDSIRDDLQRLKRDIEDIDEVGSGSGRSRGGGGADDGGGSSGGTPTARWSGSPAAAPVAVSLQLPATAIRYDVPALIRDIRANRDGIRNAIREVVS